MTLPSLNLKTGVKSFFDLKFLKSQAASFAATVVDMGLLFGLTELAGVYYVISVAIGAGCGAITNFLIGRYWSFQASESKVQSQAFRYASVALGSLGLNTVGVAVVTERLHIPYGFSKVIVAFSVGILFNYPLQRYFVFKSKDVPVLPEL